MDKPVDNYWKKRIDNLKTALEANNFEVFTAEDAEDAKRVAEDIIIPETGAKSVSWGGSMTFMATGLYESIKGNSGFEVIDVFDKSVSTEKKSEMRRKALLADLFITGTNAVVDTGVLVNLDMIGNRVAAITFGPKNVLILAGRNKIVSDLDEAMFRIKNYAAPANAMRLDKKTPCIKTSFCEECSSPDRICNYWTITEKSYPRGRIKIVLINQDLGL
ncbi:MAG: lactate utilization protein [Deltaproteobacteria bacterium]|nr:lactate utilization protein [Deltaproteobacteria bacterium]